MYNTKTVILYLNYQINLTCLVKPENLRPSTGCTFTSESEPSKNLFANQFNSVTNEFTEENKPNMPTNYTEILNQMNNNETPNQQFETQMQNLSE